MKYRLLSLLLALVLAFGSLTVLVGCGADEPPIHDGAGDETPDTPDTSDQPGDPSTPSDPSAHAHTDANADEVCDGCAQSVVVMVDFYVLNDLHGKFCDTDIQPGVDELATYLRTANTTDDHTVFLSSGDMWQGSAESNLTGGTILTEWMNELDFVAMTLGNHEFDWGSEAIRKNLKLAEFPFLAINVYDVATGKLADFCAPSVMIERGGIQIGIIGAIGDCYSSISSDMVKDVTFKVGNELTALVKAESDRLRDAGADLIVYSLHDGYGSSRDGVQRISSSGLRSYYDSSLSSGYVDVVFESHSHQRYTLIDNDGIYHLQAGGENYGLSHVEIKVNPLTGSNTVTDAGVVHTSAYAHLEDDATTEELEERYDDVIEYAYGVLGQVDRDFSGSEVADIVAKYYLDIALERWGDKYDIVLGGGYIRTRSPYDLVRGEKRYADVLSLLPFDNRLVLCSISGDKLLSQFIHSNHSDYHIALSEYGESILGKISPSGTYYIMTDSYSSTYAPNGLTEVAEYDSGVFARDLLAAAIKNGEFTVNHSDYVPTPISEALDIGWGIPQNHTTNAFYYLRGAVGNEPNATYGNFDLVDANGKSVYIYGLYDKTGNRYDAMSQKLGVGDEVVVYGQITHYLSNQSGTEKIEIINAVLIDYKKGSTPPAQPDEPDTPKLSDYELTSIADALEIGKNIDPGMMTVDTFYIVGTVSNEPNATYGNFDLKDDSGNTIYVYGLYDMSGNRYDAMGQKLKVGDRVLLCGPIMNYYNAKTGASKIELKDAVLVLRIS